MDREKLENFLSENKSEIVGVKVNGYYYDVNYILDYNLDCDDETVLSTYEVTDEDDCCSDYKSVYVTEFTMEDLLSSELEFYKLTKLEF